MSIADARSTDTAKVQYSFFPFLVLSIYSTMPFLSIARRVLFRVFVFNLDSIWKSETLGDAGNRLSEP